MVLESLFNPFVVKKRPWQMFSAGVIYTFIGLILSYIVFRDIAGILTVFLIVLATLPIIYTTIKNEEELDLKYDKEWTLLKEHTKVLIFFMFLFMGITVAFVLAYVFLPSSIVSNLFNVQEQAILNVNNAVQGNLTKNVLLINIFMNNLKVLFFCLIFSFLYGSGAIFILTWNASVVAVAIGNLLKYEISKIGSLVGIGTITSYFGATTFSVMRYMTHGLLEVLAYFVAGLAGGIISIALIKHNLEKNRVLIDSLDLILISLGILLFAAFVEVYLTPAIFIH